MKYILTYSLIFLWFCGLSQTSDSSNEINGSFGLSFGSSKKEVRQIIINKGGKCIFEAEDKDDISFTNLKMGGRDVFLLKTSFVEDKLFNIIMVFKPSLEPKSLDLFNAIKQDIVYKYKEGICERLFSGIYKDGDGFEIQAIKKGYGKVECKWIFPSTNSIYLSISQDISILLSYQSGRLSNYYYNKQKQNRSTDF